MNGRVRTRPLSCRSPIVDLFFEVGYALWRQLLHALGEGVQQGRE
jgi:hypothetical protein